MAVHIALLRAINVGGTAKLPMADLKTLCEAAGFTNVRTYIQSGNVLFESPLAARKVKVSLEKALQARMGKPHAVLVRSRDELDGILARNPYPQAPPNRVLVHFLDEPPPAHALAGWKLPGREEMALHGREIFLHFPDGQGGSKLVIPFAKLGTTRNLATVAKLAALARGDPP